MCIYHRNGRFNEASAGSIMGPYDCGSLIVDSPGGQPSEGRNRAVCAARADCAARAEPTLPRRLLEWDAKSSGRRAGSMARVGLELYSAAAASIILSRCSVSRRSRSTASVLAVCNIGRHVAGDGTNAAALPSDDRRSRSCISFLASWLSELSDGAAPTVPTAADGGFGCCISDVNACPCGNAPGIKPLRIAAASERMPKSLPRKPGGWPKCVSASLAAPCDGRNCGWRWWSGDRDRDRLRPCAAPRSGERDFWTEDELAWPDLKLNNNNIHLQTKPQENSSVLQSV